MVVGAKMVRVGPRGLTTPDLLNVTLPLRGVSLYDASTATYLFDGIGALPDSISPLPDVVTHLIDFQSAADEWVDAIPRELDVLMPMGDLDDMSLTPLFRESPIQTFAKYLDESNDTGPFIRTAGLFLLNSVIKPATSLVVDGLRLFFLGNGSGELVDPLSGHTMPLQKTDYYTHRGLQRSNYYTVLSPFGLIHENFDASVEQSGSITYLGIGIGDGNLEANLKDRLGNNIGIAAFSKVPLAEEMGSLNQERRVVDYELEAGDMNDVQIPRRFFDRIVSVYGSIYSKNQIDVLQKLFNALKVGGEAFFMMHLRPHDNNILVQVLRHTSSYFRAMGVDIVVTPDHNIDIEAYVYMRKTRDVELDFNKLLEEASEIAGRMQDGYDLHYFSRYFLSDGRIADVRPLFRATKDDSGKSMTFSELRAVMAEKIDLVASHYGLDPQLIVQKMEHSVDGESARQFLAEWLIANEPGILEDLEAGFPVEDLMRTKILLMDNSGKHFDHPMSNTFMRGLPPNVRINM